LYGPIDFGCFPFLDPVVGYKTTVLCLLLFIVNVVVRRMNAGSFLHQGCHSCKRPEGGSKGIKIALNTGTTLKRFKNKGLKVTPLTLEEIEGCKAKQ